MALEGTVEKVVFSIDGVGAAGLMPLCLKLALQRSMPNCEVRNFFWSHGYGRMLADLKDRAHIRLKASMLASEIEGLRAEQKQVQIVAKSGGSAVALDALALLKPDTVQTVVLLSPAVSPQYDLGPPLQAVQTKLYAFNSSLDQFMLGLGTSVFGTADGIKTRAAGCVGFSAPDRYEKLEEIPWHPRMIRGLNFGTHWGTSMLPFLSEHVVPLLNLE